MVDNIAPRKVWQALEAEAGARLVDVRTRAEWAYIGQPDLAAAGKQVVSIEWQVYPAMGVNPDFVAEARAAGLTPEHHIYFLCRSGVRSLAAAQAMQAAGFPHVYNIADGFEGPPDGEGHRGRMAGWKADGLPWRQR
jgi:rhodanese-related sulfurtransferase